jgi:hypothetical protein
MLERFRIWFRFGYWLDTPQGIALLLSAPVCWSVAALRFVVPEVAEVRAFASPIWLYLFSPFLGFMFFVKDSYPSFGSSWLATFSVCLMSGFPFYASYIKP